MTPNIDPRQAYNQRWKLFHYISGIAMKVYIRFKYGQGTEVYAPMLKYLLTKDGLTVEQDARLPMFWDDTPIGDTCTFDMLVRGNSADVVVKLLSQDIIDTSVREPFKHRMEITHSQYGMIINFSPTKLYSEWYYRDPDIGVIDKIKLL